MGGSELRAQVAKRLPDIKVIFMSGYTDDSIAGLDILDNDVEFIERPSRPALWLERFARCWSNNVEVRCGGQSNRPSVVDRYE